MTARISKITAGFTLIELMIVVVIVAVGMALAAPSFYTTLKNNRLRTEADRIVTSFNLARSEAVKRSVDVVVCASPDGATCSGGPADGWLVYADLDQDAVLDPADIPIKVYEALPADYSITATNGGAYPGGSIVFYPDGSSNSPDTIFLCPSDDDAEAAWAISVNAPGRVTAVRGNNGGAYKCAP
ncbi:prepilin-type N-terminal cleavage/methylation domain-containing protein [Seongchinamella sediminis]|uniref:Type II secretion system protein H n=1 Tax=Seongchinamella sediminis TaxID=2283635 RepID=A0A3L7DXV3_9GAMM|nr:GspH/FimT family pseudopilin [Seongchinamella sediminis]RLQ21449.1 prepilin-type N-terminal cleavage/methylation domain-containing protein [Seongchinamella sediminis]